MARRRQRGEGSLFQDSRGYWVGEVTLPNGKKKRKYSKTQKVVKTWLREENTAIAKGTWVETEKILFSDFLTRYMDEVCTHSLRPTTLQAYQSLINNHILPSLGNIRLTELRPDMLQTFYNEKLKSGLSKRTVQFIHSIIHKALNHALKQGLVIRNVSDLVEAPTPKRKAPPTLTAGEVKQFLKAVEDHPYYPIYVLATATGMREGELLSLHWGDVNLEMGSLYVRYTLQVIKGEGMKLAEPKTEKSKRVIPLPEYALEVLRGTKRESTGDLVFSTKTGNFISPRNLIRHFKSVLVKANLPDMTFHAFSRHTHASLLLSAGVHPKVVQERLGHSQISLTMDTYSHVLPTLQTEAADKVNTLLS